MSKPSTDRKKFKGLLREVWNAPTTPSMIYNDKGIKTRRLKLYWPWNFDYTDANVARFKERAAKVFGKRLVRAGVKDGFGARGPSKHPFITIKLT